MGDEKKHDLNRTLLPKWLRRNEIWTCPAELLLGEINDIDGWFLMCSPSLFMEYVAMATKRGVEWAMNCCVLEPPMVLMDDS